MILMVQWHLIPKDFILNVLLFIPVGFLYRHSPKKKSRFYWKEIGFGIALSLFIEITQVFIDGRTTNGCDVIANGSGAFLGARVFDYAAGRLKEQDSFRISSLKIPLVNLVILLTPLLWLTCIAAGDEPMRLYLLIPLGVFGSGLLSSIHVNRLVYIGVPPNRFILTSLIWFTLPTIPAIIQHPKHTASVLIVMGAIIMVQALFQKDRPSRSRRFEMRTLKNLFPVYGAYLLLLVLLQATKGVGKIPEHFQLMTTMHMVEFIAAFTILGYVTAQMRGRKEESPLFCLGVVFAVSSAMVVLISLTRGVSPVTVQKLVLGLSLIGSSLYGVMLYRLQLAAFKRM